MTEQDIDELTREDAEGESEPSRLKGPRAFRNVSRELTEEDLANPSPAVQKLLLNEIDRLEIEKEEYREEYSLCMDRFHEADKKAAVLEQKIRTALSRDIVFGGCLAVGGALFGLVSGLWAHQPYGWIVVAFGVMLFGIGIAAKVKAS